MQKTAYLEFIELDDYCTHLAAMKRNDTRLEISVVTERTARNKHFTVTPSTVYAVATCLLATPDAEHIATWAQVILCTNNLNAQMERDLPHDQQKGRIAMFKNFESVRAEFEKRSFRVERGKWTLTTPDFLK